MSGPQAKECAVRLCMGCGRPIPRRKLCPAKYATRDYCGRECVAEAQTHMSRRPEHHGHGNSEFLQSFVSAYEKRTNREFNNYHSPFASGVRIYGGCRRVSDYQRNLGSVDVGFNAA
jgi:hypothetical protein